MIRPAVASLAPSAPRRLSWQIPIAEPLSIDGAAITCHSLGMSDTSTVEVGPKGRVVIPASIRRELAIGEGTQLVAMVQDGGVLLLPGAEVKRRLRKMFSAISISLGGQLIDDRRREAVEEERS